MSSSNSLPTLYQQFIHISRYSRWLDDEKRRETWEETVSRYFDFFDEHLKNQCNFTLSKSDRTMLEESVLNLSVMPSMRCLMSAGMALKRDNIAGYNCSYIAVDRTTAFDEILYILMCGTGVGFSVERQFVAKLPVIADEFHKTDTTIHVADSKMGWAKGFKELVHLLYGGQIPMWDVSKVRPAGAPLKTFGGRASGPGPLEDLFNFTINLFQNAAGRKLTSIECHDLVCKVAEIVVVGGVRRSALISLSNLSDDRMRHAKSGHWWEMEGQRALANNSVTYTEKPDIGIFMDEWKSLYESKSGERGIFNRVAAQEKSNNGRRDHEQEFGTNPCGEILLRSNEFCNLSEVVIRKTDTLETLKEKVRQATIIGTLQSSLLDFKYINKRWAANCEEERLLGVSLTGIMDNTLTNGREGREKLVSALQELLLVAQKTNEIWAKKLGINASVAITCVKPSGTVSQLTDAASGIHARHAEYYIRTIRADKKDPLARFMAENGFPYEDDVTKPDYTWIFSFPIKVDADSIFRDDRDTMEQLEHWMIYKEHWCEHNPSVTIYVKEHEWLKVGAWVYENFDKIGGISFLPHTDHVYRQAPYQDITKDEYDKIIETFPKEMDWVELAKYESTDMTIGTQELNCSAGTCEIV
jgi:ribonucleoside-triphosphate reductase